MPIAVDVLNAKGEKVDSVRLPDEVFAVKARPGAVHEVITGHLAGLRRGTHSTKTRGEVSGGGLKPWKQKHTGRARAGSTRSPLWRHGGVIFGPKPRSYVQGVPAGKRRLALKAVLSGFAAEGRIRVVDRFDVDEPKTRRAAELARALKLGPKSLVVVDTISPTLDRASRNLPDLTLCRSQNLTAYGALLAGEIVFTRPALDHVARRLAGAAA